MFEKLKQFIQKMNEQGVPLPMVRIDGKASITATFCFLSFNTALLGQLGKFAGLVGTVDLTNANYLFLTCLMAYLGRKFQGSGTEIKVSKVKGKKDA